MSDLGATLVAALPSMRAQAESLMLDTCTIARPTEGATPDPLTGVTPTAAVYTGRCKVQTAEAQEQTPDAGGHTFTVQRYAVHVPVGAYRPSVGDVVTITAAALDPYLAGRRFRVTALLHKTLATAYRLSCEDVAA